MQRRFWMCFWLTQVLLVFLDRVCSEETAVTMKCSCYTFDESHALSWTESRQMCQESGGDLVSMETIAEWRFIRDEIVTNSTVAEWHIGLKKRPNGKWVWTNGMALDWAECDSKGCFPWQPREPSGLPEDVALMSKNYPPGTKGLFNDIRRDRIARSFICERPADNCKGKEFVRRCSPPTTTRQPLRSPSPNILSTTAKSLTSKETSRQSAKSYSTEPAEKRTTATSHLPFTKNSPATSDTPKLRGATTLTTQPRYDDQPSQLDEDQPSDEREASSRSPNTLLAAVVASGVAVVLVMLSVVIILRLRRSKRRRHPSIRLRKKRCTTQPRGQLTYVFDGYHVHATVNWGKEKKTKVTCDRMVHGCHTEESSTLCVLSENRGNLFTLFLEFNNVF